MKKIYTMALMLALASPALAAPQAKQPAAPEPCQYTVLQNLVRDARDHERVFELIRAGVSMDDSTITCGGSLLQLAIRRGNASILNGILTQDKNRANRRVSLKSFPITGAPEVIPAVLFAAYYAPSETVFKVMLEAGADVSVRDEKGHDILWYLERNPVLRKTALEDEIQVRLQNRLLDRVRKQEADSKPVVQEEEPNVADITLAEPTE